MPVQRMRGLDALGLIVATNGSVPTAERARTLLEAAYPSDNGAATFAEASTQASWRDNMYRQLADIVILVSLPIAGCTLAASIAAGLADRKHLFSLLRLTGARLAMLRRGHAGISRPRRACHAQTLSSPRKCGLGRWLSCGSASMYLTPCSSSHVSGPAGSCRVSCQTRGGGGVWYSPHHEAGHGEATCG